MDAMPANVKNGDACSHPLPVQRGLPLGTSDAVRCRTTFDRGMRETKARYGRRVRARPALTFSLLVACFALARPPAVSAEESASGPTRSKRTVGEAVRTGGHAARDGALTFGRATRAFFKGGTDAARSTWNENATKTKDEAKAGARRTREAADGK